VFMLECNPRPNQIFHLGHRVGADLCKTLANGLFGHQQPTARPKSKTVVPLFPQSWFFDEQAALAGVEELDVPRNDPSLLKFMLNRGQQKGKDSAKLQKLLGPQETGLGNYAFG
jgi:hypothetical protein